MAEKTTKKTTVKKTAVKKNVSKPVTAKKTTVKKTPTKKVVAAPVAEMHACGCDKSCACGGKCCEHGHCTKKKCTFGRFLKKLVLVMIIFALGFASAKMCCVNKRGKAFPKPEFNNGCLVVKCPKMVKMAPMMDTDNDGCISKQEFKAARKNFKKEMRPEHPEMPQEPEMGAPAPQVTE